VWSYLYGAKETIRCLTMYENSEKIKRQRILSGTVVSDKMEKTITVEVERTFTHPLLKRVIRSSKKYKVHDEHSVARLGDVVKIYEGRPVSKTKYMYLAEVVSSSSSNLGKL
jgi:small subunit ribosomal protein S17